MPIGEYRVGLSSASKAIGYSEKWLRRVLKIMTLTKDSSQRSSKQVNLKKNKTRKKSLVNQPKSKDSGQGDRQIIKY